MLCQGILGFQKLRIYSFQSVPLVEGVNCSEIIVPWNVPDLVSCWQLKYMHTDSWQDEL